MGFFDNVVNKSNAIIKERLNNPFGQLSQSADQADQQQPAPQAADESATRTQIQQQASTSSADRPTSASVANEGDGQASGDDKNSQFAAIAADAEAVAQKAAKGAQKFGTFLFSMANKAGQTVGQTVSQTAKQVKQVVENTNILTDFTREQQEFVRDHGGSMQAGELPWCAAEGQAIDEQSSNYIRDQVLSLSQDKRNFVRSPPQRSDYKFEAQKFYPIALSLLKEDPNLNKMRYELVPKLVSEDTFWCNYFYRVETIKNECGAQKSAGWASSRSSSGEGPDELVSGAQGGSQSLADEPASPGYASTGAPASKASTTRRQDSQSSQATRRPDPSDFSQPNATAPQASSTTTTTTSGDAQQPGGVGDQFGSGLASFGAAAEADREAPTSAEDDLRSRLRELNIGSFDGSQDG